MNPLQKISAYLLGFQTVLASPRPNSSKLDIPSSITHSNFYERDARKEG
jgi:hypothetical protein